MPFAPHRIDAVVFDMDGVLLDTERLYLQAAFEAAEELGFTMPEEVHRATVGIPMDVAEELVRTHMGPDFPYEAFDRHLHASMRETLDREVPQKPGAAELLEVLTGQQMPVAVATSTGRAAAHLHLEKAGLKMHFEVIVTRNDVTRGKPHPEPFLTAAARLGVDPTRCLAIEDSHNGVRAAHAAGMQTVMVPDLLPATPEIAALCVTVLDDLAAVQAVFGKTRLLHRT